MKKSFLIITSLILLCIMIVGCQTTNATITTSNELNKNLNLLSNTVSRLDTVDNEYLVSNELYSMSKVPTPNKTFKQTIATNNFAEPININNQSLKEILSNELINRLYCDSNGNCKLCNEKFVCNDNNMCNSCNQTIICDSNGNCTSCGNVLYLDNNNNCNSCKKSCISSTSNSNISNNTKSCLQKISTNNSEIIAEPISAENDNNNLNNDINNNDAVNNFDKYDNNYTYKMIYFEDSYNPNLRYTPRFVNNIDTNIANSNISNYIEKLQKLYTMTADVVEANNTLANYKILILDNINETKELNDCILSGNCTPTNNQVLALNNYIEDLKSTVYNLRKCNGNLANELNKISASNTGISHSIDVTNSNYLRILNQIDTRISYHENAIATLEQIQYLLQDAQNRVSNNTLVEDLNNNVITPDYNNNNDGNLDAENEVLDNNQIDDNIEDSYDANLDEETNNDIIIDNTPATNTDNNTIIDNTPVIDNNTDTYTDVDTDANTNVENDINYDNNANNDIDDTIVNNEDNNLLENDDINSDLDTDDNEDTTTSDTTANVEVVDDNDNISNIDTYQNNFSNLDTADNEINNNDDIVNNDSIINDNVNNNIVTNDNNVNNNATTNQTTQPQMVDGSINNFNNNNENSIISQNNLDNNNIGNNSYRYDSNGSLYNNTNGYNSNNNLTNLNDKNNNVNTYKYNTLIDSINRGTIDNGINNL